MSNIQKMIIGLTISFVAMIVLTLRKNADAHPDQEPTVRIVPIFSELTRVSPNGLTQGSVSIRIPGLRPECLTFDPDADGSYYCEVEIFDGYTVSVTHGIVEQQVINNRFQWFSYRGVDIRFEMSEQEIVQAYRRAGILVRIGISSDKHFRFIDVPTAQEGFVSYFRFDESGHLHDFTYGTEVPYN